MKRKLKPPPGKRYIYRTYRKCPNSNKLLWARDYGLKAWPILVDD